MTQQPTLFDLHPSGLAQPAPVVPAPSGEQLKRRGMDRAAIGKDGLLAHARSLAYDVARGLLPHADGQRRADGLCTADDVAAAWERDNAERTEEGFETMPWLGNAAGSVFAGNAQAWEWTGQLVKSVRPGAHQNLLRVWRYRGGEG